MSGRVIADITNNYRSSKGFHNLRYNEVLSKSAEEKVDLIFEEQHFDHIGKSGATMQDLINGAGYKFIRIGENLAYGTYYTEDAIVTSWINSPGHHALLISPDFLDIGVAVKKGTFNGNEVWVAVQHFGRPLSLCENAMPSDALKERIAVNRDRVNSLAREAEEKANILRSFGVPSGDEYTRIFNERNKIVKDHNNLLESVRSDINIYNNQIETYNVCMAA